MEDEVQKLKEKKPNEIRQVNIHNKNEPELKMTTNMVPTSNERDKKEKTREEIIFEMIIEYLAIMEHYIFALISVFLAGFVIYYTNFFKHLFNNPLVDPNYFKISMGLFLVILFMFCYISFYLPYKLNSVEFDKTFDRIIPYCTVIGLLAIIALIKCVWTVYYYFSLLIVPIIVLGYAMSANFSPNGKLGNIFAIAVFLSSVFSGYYIDNPGHTFF